MKSTRSNIKENISTKYSDMSVLSVVFSECFIIRNGTNVHLRVQKWKRFLIITTWGMWQPICFLYICQKSPDSWSIIYLILYTYQTSIACRFLSDIPIPPWVGGHEALSWVTKVLILHSECMVSVGRTFTTVGVRVTLITWQRRVMY